MLEPNETHDRIQNIRVKNLEQQVHLLRAELKRIREGLMPQKDIIRLTSLADKLKELNDVLKDLRNHYNMEKMKQSNEKCFQSPPTAKESNCNHAEDKKEEIEKAKQYEDKYFPRSTANNVYQVNGFEQLPSSNKNVAENFRENYKSDENIKIMTDVKPNNAIDVDIKNVVAANAPESDDLNDEPFKVCKQIMDESKPPGSILGNYLITLQDYRTDPELRRQRLERKEKEKLQKLRAKNDEYHLSETKEATNGSTIQRDSTESAQKPTPENYSNNHYGNAKPGTPNGSNIQRDSIKKSQNPAFENYSNNQQLNVKATTNGSIIQRATMESSPAAEKFSNNQPRNAKTKATTNGSIIQRATTESSPAPEKFSNNQPRNGVYCCSTADESGTDSDKPIDIVLIRENLKEVVYDVVGDIDRVTIALTVVLETDQLYHISVSTTSTGESLACFFSTEDAIQEAKKQNLFQEFLTLFVVNAENSRAQKDRILGHSFEFIKLDV